MNLSPTSVIQTSKPFLPYHPNYNKNHQSNKVFSSVSCKSATKPSCGYNNKTNFYKMLCLSTEKASMDEIKKAYRSMALRHHPDVCLDPSMKEESTKMFVKLIEAYQTLSDPVLRKEYDYEMLLTSANSGRTFKVDLNDQLGRRRKWQEQIVELKRRSNSRMAQREGSWGCRMRAKS
ncbi:hypothetical protein FEM48_Zijuj09G0184100 [Ziziphus jujuba var. spinosa]|uniref:J domain-containing protein n=1 Tax=Ziziphus jujuba var. spinosa TaxID=714518 RepID=A0A978UUK6_ZIZJJ|nr:hypothetical protein FEM48_Zijuj09G0184100 [Ziziphus jujuba var. spinosa]